MKRHRPLRAQTLAVPLMMFVSACGIVHPPGYLTLREGPAHVIKATPWIPYGVAPNEWDLPDGRHVRIAAQQTVFNRGQSAADLTLHVAFSATPDATWLECATDLYVSGLPQTRFGCWTEGAQVQGGFWFSEQDSCHRHTSSAANIFTQPACWTGTLDTGHERYQVAFAHTRLGSIVVNRVTWTSTSGDIIQAAELVVEGRIKLYRPHSRPDEDVLLLHALALHRYVHWL